MSAVKKKQDVIMERSDYKSSSHRGCLYNIVTRISDFLTCMGCGDTKPEYQRGLYSCKAHLPKCEPLSSNSEKLHHYRVSVLPDINFAPGQPTTIFHNYNAFRFEGFSIFSHYPLKNIHPCYVPWFYGEYTIHLIEENFPDNFTVAELDLFYEYVFQELLEVDFQSLKKEDGCILFHVMPRFVHRPSRMREELLPIEVILQWLQSSRTPCFDKSMLAHLSSMPEKAWMQLVDETTGAIVTNPARKPASLRVDRLKRHWQAGGFVPYIVHFQTTPSDEKSYRYLEFSTEGFLNTGLRVDVVQHVLVITAIAAHLDIYDSIQKFQRKIEYHFKDQYLLQCALTHCSFKPLKTPPHINILWLNCGLRKSEFYRRDQFNMRNRRKGPLRRHGNVSRRISDVNENERLEFLGDRVLAFIIRSHLFYMFPTKSLHELTSYSNAMESNCHFVVLAKRLELHKYILRNHGMCLGPCLNRPLACTFEALLAALYLDGGMAVADRIFGKIVFIDEPVLLNVWENLQPHPLQVERPFGDRDLIDHFERYTHFEKLIGIEFQQIRLLDDLFAPRDYYKKTFGVYRNLHFIGNAVQRLITTEYAFKTFPNNQVRDLSQLCSVLRDKFLLESIANELKMLDYVNDLEIHAHGLSHLVTGLIGALFVDKNFNVCKEFLYKYLFKRL